MDRNLNSPEPEPPEQIHLGHQHFSHAHSLNKHSIIDLSNAFIKQRPSLPGSGFKITPETLSQLVNFDQRNSPEQYKLLQSPQYGGVEGLSHLLKTDLNSGLLLTSFCSKEDGLCGIHEVKDGNERAATFGENRVEPAPSDTILKIIFNTIKEDPIIKILMVGAVVILVIGMIEDVRHGWIEGVAILIAVLIVLSVTAGNDYSKDLQFKKLLLLQSDKRVKVIRNGKQDQISSWDVLVGDLIALMPGDEIPADGLFVSGSRLVVDESPLTGETIPVKKNNQQPFLFSGCQVSEGTGRMLVTAVGPKSCAGQIQALLNEKQNEETVLQQRLKQVAVVIGKIGIASGILTFLGLTLRWLIDKLMQRAAFEISFLVDLVTFFVTGVTVIVVAVPEGLPLAVTISLAFSMFKMIRDQCFVRHLSASETMGEATCICTDKTGTLTENKMTVVKFMADGRQFSGEGSGDSNAQPFGPQSFPSTYSQVLCESISVNSTCFIRKKEDDSHPVIVGSATEGALLTFTKKLGANHETLREQYSKVENGQLNFSSETKKMMTTIQGGCPLPVQSPYRLHVKGASEIILSKCQFIINQDATSIQPMTEEQRKQISHTIQQWAGDGLRTLCLAFKQLSEKPEVDTLPNMDSDLIFIGLAGIKDPIRKEVPAAVQKCQQAGLTVRMVTGDNLLTASKIAQECGILNRGGLVMEGPEFRALSEEKKKEILPRLQVLARSSPTDKFMLVQLLKQMGEVVAVTGDGTNDAPALKEADVGFAMGISGTQIAMNACDIMLLDDNFQSIVQSIKWGRNVLQVIRKFLQFQLGVNLAAILITFIGSVSTSSGGPPLNTVQLLWVNLIMDSLGALALASEEPDDSILNEAPHSKKESLITKEMKQYVGSIVIYQVCMCLFVLLNGYQYVGIDSSDTTGIHTLVFTAFVLMQIFNETTARQLNHEYNILKGILKNRLFLWIMFVVALVQAFVVQFGGGFVSTEPLNGTQWGGCLLIAFLQVPYILLCRFGFRLLKQYRNRHSTKVKTIAKTSGILNEHLQKSAVLEKEEEETKMNIFFGPGEEATLDK